MLALSQAKSFQPQASNLIFQSQKAIDTSYAMVMYKLLYVIDPNEPDAPKGEDFGCLQIGQKYSHYFSYNVYRADSIAFEDVKANARGIKGATNGLGESVYRNYPNSGTSTVTHRVTDFGRFCYSEDNPVISWEMLPDIKVVAGYSCSGATCNFRGRRWTVWYTSEIPISEGPWKLKGLPGLVLMAEDSQGHYCWESVSVSKRKSPIYWYDIDWENMSREKTYKHIKWIYAHPISYQQQFVKNSAKVVNGKLVMLGPSNDAEFAEPYNPIELEW